MSGIFNILSNTVKELAVSRFTTPSSKLDLFYTFANITGEFNLNIKLRGIVAYRTVFRLIFCSKEIAKKIRCKYVEIKRTKNAWVLKPNGPHKLWIRKDGRIEISVTKLLTDEEKQQIKSKTKYTQVILSGEFSLGKFVQNARAYLDPIYENKDIPKDVLWINFQLNKYRSKGDRLIFTRKALYNLAKKMEIRVLYQKTESGIVLRFTKDRLRGRKICPTRIRKNQYHAEVAFPPILQNFLKDKIGIPLSEFGLKESNFTDNKTEKKLLDALKRKGMDAYPGTTQTLGDIFFKNWRGFIEITTWKPIKQQLGLRHSITPMQIRSRILEAEHFSIHRKINPNFIIVDEIWKNNKYIQREAKEAEKFKVYTIFTTFKDLDEVADEICKKLSR